MNIVIDTSTLISAIGWKEGKPRKILNLGLSNNFTILISGETMKELKGVLSRNKFDFIEKELKEEFLILLKEISKMVKIKTSIKLCKDPKDNMFIELAIDGKADYIISSDADLLGLDNAKGIKIVTPSEFLEMITE